VAVVTVATAAVAGHRRRLGRVRDLHAMQEAYSRQLIDSQEVERRRISSELHDAIGQQVAIIKARARACQPEASEPARAAAELAEIASLAEQINVEMKTIAHDLRPYQLETLGVSRTIEAMVRRVGDACPILFTADITPIDDALPESAHIHVYRIVQECVSNVVKHSNAARATVTVARRERSVEIAIEDNGDGFEPDHFRAPGRRSPGFGLMGIHERARLLGGQLEIRSRPGRGTAVILRLPAGRPAA
jgi:signal transduction histidine kinase